MSYPRTSFLFFGGLSSGFGQAVAYPLGEGRLYCSAMVYVHRVILLLLLGARNTLAGCSPRADASPSRWHEWKTARVRGHVRRAAEDSLPRRCSSSLQRTAAEPAEGGPCSFHIMDCLRDIKEAFPRHASYYIGSLLIRRGTLPVNGTG